jgi:hypothetical protein
VYGDQIRRMRPLILRQDPTGLFRTRTLSQIFDLPY